MSKIIGPKTSSIYNLNRLKNGNIYIVPYDESKTEEIAEIVEAIRNDTGNYALFIEISNKGVRVPASVIIGGQKTTITATLHDAESFKYTISVSRAGAVTFSTDALYIYDSEKLEDTTKAPTGGVVMQYVQDYVAENLPSGGGSGGEEWELAKEITVTEPVTVIYETFAKGYKKLHIEFDDMRSTLEAPTSASQVWFNLNSASHNNARAFRLCPSNSSGGGTVYGTNYTSYGVIDIDCANDFITCNYLCYWGAANIADYGSVLRIADVGDSVNSLRLHIGGNHNFATTLKMKVWGVRA